MDRGVFVGGGLICASFLLAVLFNEAARQPVRAPERVQEATAEEEPQCEGSIKPSIQDSTQPEESGPHAPRGPPSACK